MADCDVINGGTPATPPADILDAGTPTTVGVDTVDGGQPLSVCPPFNDTSAAAYTGLLGDGGQGHSVIFHDRRGTPIIELPCRAVTDVLWSRELSEVSRCVLTGGADAAPEALEDLRPLVHHATVYRDGDFVWNGIVHAIEGDRDTFDVAVFDYATLMWRTRARNTKQWTETDPVRIAAELWQSVYEWHRIPSPPPAEFASAVAYDYQLTKDAVRLDKPMADLVKMGMDWTIFRGRPVIVPTVRSKALISPIGYADCDFAEQLKVRRDGTRFTNDLLLKGKNYSAFAVNDMAELRMQDIVNLDAVFGAANVQKAADQLVARRSAIRVQVKVPSNATLNPTSPLGINDLMPGVIVPVHTSLAGGVTAERRIEKVEVRQSASGEQVSLTLGQVPLPPSSSLDFEDL